jgi:hypothetical protein
LYSFPANLSRIAAVGSKLFDPIAIMRFSTSALAAALPALVAAQEPFQEYKAQFQTFLDKMSSYIPNPGAHDPVAAAEAKLGAMKMHTLTLENWKDTLYEPVSADATTPVEWWVLTSGRNNTCRGTWCCNAFLFFRFAVCPLLTMMVL